MLTQALFDKLLQLRLPAFRDGLRTQQNNPQYAELSFEERLALLVDQECLRRQNNRLQRLLKAANFPFPAVLEDLDFSPGRGLERARVLELAQGQWVQNHQHLFVLGPTGAGKTYVSCALATAAVRQGFPVRYFRTSRLLPQLAQARQQNTFHDLLQRLTKIPVLVFDDWLRDPLTPAQAQDLLEILDDRFGQASLILASQLPVAEWHVCIPNPTLADALLDRLVHNAHRLQLEGESQRKLRAIRSMPHT